VGPAAARHDEREAVVDQGVASYWPEASALLRRGETTGVSASTQMPWRARKVGRGSGPSGCSAKRVARDGAACAVPIVMMLGSTCAKRARNGLFNEMRVARLELNATASVNAVASTCGKAGQRSEYLSTFRKRDGLQSHHRYALAGCAVVGRVVSAWKRCPWLKIAHVMLDTGFIGYTAILGASENNDNQLRALSVPACVRRANHCQRRCRAQGDGVSEAGEKAPQSTVLAPASWHNEDGREQRSSSVHLHTSLLTLPPSPW